MTKVNWPRLAAVASFWVLLLLGFVIAIPAGAQDWGRDWSSPEVMVDPAGTVAVSSMDLVADQAGQLHLFYPHQPEESVAYAIEHVRWDGTQWTAPVNVMVNPDGSNVAHIRATIDGQQTIHLVWGGGLNKLWYANAPAALAATAHGWSRPQTIATAHTEAGLAVAPNGTLYVAYALAPSSSNVAIVSSADGGTTWSAVANVAVTAPGTTPGEVDLAIDGAGRLHVTWTEHTLPDGVPLTGVFYSRSLDGGVTWQTPLQVAGERHGELGVGTVKDDQVHLVWRSNIGGDGTFHQWSADGGETWSVPDRFADRGGMSGMPSFAVDSAGALHYVIGPAKVATWQAGRLGAHVDVAREPRLRAEQGQERSPPERAVLAITGGNQLHVVFETGFERLWHTTRLLEVPAIATAPLPTVDQNPTPTLTRVANQVAATLGTPSLSDDLQSRPKSGGWASPLSSVILAATASMAVVLAVGVWRLSRRRL